METPQSAPKNWLIEGYERAEKLNLSLTDDMQAIELIEKDTPSRTKLSKSQNHLSTRP